jgi:hypothetical protein
MSEDNVNNGQFVILELMGRKVIAGYATEEIRWGKPLIRIDVPETNSYPKFTQWYGGEAIYCITPVSEEVAKLTAERMAVNPVSVYVPDLITKEKLEEVIESYKKKIDLLQEGE